MEKIAALRRTVLFGGLPREALAELAALAQKRELARGEILFLVHEEAAGLFVIVSGQIRAYRVNSQGREQTIHIEKAGATLAEVPVFDDGAYPATAIAEARTTVLFLDKAAFRKFLLQHPEVAMTALKLMAERLRRHVELVDALALQQVGQRLAGFFLGQARDCGTHTEDGLRIDIALSNEELANRVGSVREVVSRTLMRLESEGLLIQDHNAQQGRQRSFVIPDEARLSAYAEPSSQSRALKG